MNQSSKRILQRTAKELTEWRIRCRTETVHLDRRLEVLMAALANMCVALAEEELEVIDVEEVKD